LNPHLNGFLKQFDKLNSLTIPICLQYFGSGIEIPISSAFRHYKHFNCLLRISIKVVTLMREQKQNCLRLYFSRF